MGHFKKIKKEVCFNHMCADYVEKQHFKIGVNGLVPYLGGLGYC